MLMQRVLTSIVMLSIILGAVFALPAKLFYLFIGLIISVGIWEWASLAGLKSLPSKCLYLLFMMGLMFATLHAPLPVSSIFVAGIGFWLVAFFLICAYSGIQVSGSKQLVLALAGLPLFIPGWIAFTWLRDQEYFAFHLLSLLALVAAADIGAYFSGRAFGKRKLAPRVSPNKTWEGFIGGLLSSAIVISLITLILISRVSMLDAGKWLILIACAMLIASFSVIGDLFESMIKRNRDVKDSGSILPGHGGILDRVDGLTAAAPVYALLLLFLAPLFN